MILTRRRAIATLAVGATAALAAACQSIGAPAASKPTQSANDQPRPGGRLRVGRSDDLVTTDGMFFQSNSLGTTYGTVYERLVDYDDQLNALPMLADSWQFSADARQLTFKLRQNAKWHSGGDFTSSDVKWNLERIQDPKVAGGQWLRFSKWFESIDTPDPKTVVLHLDAPRPTALDFFIQLNMVERNAVNAPNAGTTAVGTGPFTFGEWRQGESLTFNKNANFTTPHAAYLDAVEVTITSDAAALPVRLESGALDAISDPPLRDMARLKDDANYTTILTRPGFYVLGVNTFEPGANKILQDKRVRQALNLAIDRPRFCQSVLLGLSEPWNLPWPSYSEAYEPAKQSVTAVNLEKARALLNDAGVSSGEVEIIYRSTDGELAKFVQIYQADLAKIGITLSIKPLEAAAFTNAQRTRQYQLQANTTASAQYHPNTLFYFDGGVGRYFGGVDQATVDAVSSELDVAKRKQLYSAMNDFILDQSLDMTIGQTQRALISSKKVRALSRGVNQVTRYLDAYLSA